MRLAAIYIGVMCEDGVRRFPHGPWTWERHMLWLNGLGSRRRRIEEAVLWRAFRG